MAGRQRTSGDKAGDKSLRYGARAYVIRAPTGLGWRRGRSRPTLDHHRNLVLRIGYRILRDSCEAQDLVQDVRLHAFRKSQSFDAGWGWLIPIAYPRPLDRREHLNLRRSTKAAVRTTLSMSFRRAQVWIIRRKLDVQKKLASGLWEVEGKALCLARFGRTSNLASELAIRCIDPDVRGLQIKRRKTESDLALFRE
jgi:hypothetical protein